MRREAAPFPLSIRHFPLHGRMLLHTPSLCREAWRARARARRGAHLKRYGVSCFSHSSGSDGVFVYGLPVRTIRGRKVGGLAWLAVLGRGLRGSCFSRQSAMYFGVGKSQTGFLTCDCGAMRMVAGRERAGGSCVGALPEPSGALVC